jgi:crotonobetainyl-CoA:carnitine CoA-transferase CaiB-like acyl-CoA transferase
MTNPSSKAGPLDGIRVVDLTAMVAGPMATALLADQGADVIKIEPPGTGDLIRKIGCSRGGISAIFGTLNRNKRSVMLDLGQPRGLAVLRRLVARADVFVQNFRPGVAEQMGIGEAALREVAPDLVYVSLSGFGETGPYARRRVYDSVIQALSGMAASQADPRTGVPELVRNIVADKATGLAAAQAITAALFARERGAGGQHVRLAMLDAAIAFLWPDVMQAHTFLGPGATSPAPAHAAVSVRRTADGYITVSAVADREFEGLCRALERPELARDERFRDTASRFRHSDVLAAVLDEVTGSRTTASWCERLAAEEVPHAPVNRLETLHQDEQVIASALLIEMQQAQAGRMRIPRPVARFDATPASLRRPPPSLGEHGAEVLRELGLPESEIADLRAKKILG